ncbi:MAG TPA: helix-turn-helix domain-containing protein [Galbitalea sp.]|nr:helix-turn-helix domain-containing protein [Galbitalea sp.]
MVERSFHITDSATLRALAHPLRQRIVWELSVREYGRAADLARIIDEPANSVSYHLRALANAGMIEEAPEFARDSRDRVWRMAHPEGYYTAPGSPASDMLVEEQLSWLRGMLTEALPRDEATARGEYLGAAMLTREQAHQMFMEVADILERWRLLGAEAASADPDDAAKVFHRIVMMVGNR